MKQEVPKDLYLSDIGFEIKRQRKNSGLTQSAFIDQINQVAAKTNGVKFAPSQSNWSKIEKGERAFEPSLLYSISAVLGVAPAELFLLAPDTFKTDEELEEFYTEVCRKSLKREPPRSRKLSQAHIDSSSLDWGLIASISKEICRKANIHNVETEQLGEIFEKIYMYHLSRREMQLFSFDQASIAEFLSQYNIKPTNKS